MSSNRRRNANLLPVARILLAGTLLVTVGGGALFYVNAKNDIEALDEVYGLMSEIRQAWEAVPGLIPQPARAGEMLN